MSEFNIHMNNLRLIAEQPEGYYDHESVSAMCFGAADEIATLTAQLAEARESQWVDVKMESDIQNIFTAIVAHAFFVYYEERLPETPTAKEVLEFKNGWVTRMRTDPLFAGKVRTTVAKLTDALKTQEEG